MSNQPNWDKAPEGATHWGPEGFYDGEAWSDWWYQKTTGGWCINIDGDWIHRSYSIEDYPQRISSFIERPTINQQLTVPGVKESLTTEKVVCSKMETTTWNGQGLPPVGAECEARTASGWLKSIILYHGTGQCLGLVAVVFWFNGNENLAWCREFRPIKTERDRWITEAMKASSDILSSRQLGKIYDAGLAKLPE